MCNLVKLDIDNIATKASAVMESFPQIAAAYVFGSSLGKCRPDSDIDLGLILDAKQNITEMDKMDLREEILLKLKNVGNHEYDISFIDPDSTIFTFRVFSEGKLIYVKDENFLTDMLEKVSRRYADDGPRYLRALEEILEG